MSLHDLKLAHAAARSDDERDRLEIEIREMNGGALNTIVMSNTFMRGCPSRGLVKTLARHRRETDALDGRIDDKMEMIGRLERELARRPAAEVRRAMKGPSDAFMKEKKS